MSREIVPLCELKDSPKIRVNLSPLPSGLEEKIGVNLEKIDILRRMGNFERIIIERDNESYTPPEIFPIGELNFGGAITLRKVIIKERPKGKFNIEGNDKTDLRVKLNVSEDISENIGVFNQMVRKTIVEGGTEHLLNPRTGNFVSEFFNLGVNFGRAVVLNVYGRVGDLFSFL